MYYVQGEEVYGMFRLSPNGRNVRDLDIEIDVDFAVSLLESFSFQKTYRYLYHGFYVSVGASRIRIH